MAYMVLEAVVTQDLWFWHAYFGSAGSNNDINVFDRSPLMNMFVSEDSVFRRSYTVNGTIYPLMYLLTDGIYPELSIFVKPISELDTNK